MAAIDAIQEKQRVRALEAALAIAGACLTRAQLQLLSAALAGKSATEIRVAFEAVLPAEEERTGILLPYLTTGKLREFPARANDLVVALLAVAAAPPSESVSAALRGAPGLISMQDSGAAPSSIGKAEWYTHSSNRIGPAAWRSLGGDQVPPAAVWRGVALTPESLGVGFAGTSEVKGTLGGVYRDPARAPYGTGSRAAADNVWDAASAEAEQLERGTAQ